MDKIFETEKKTLEIYIDFNLDANQKTFIKISDNSIGMSEAELKKAVRVGVPPDDPSGRSKYGLGMKTAACWFGDYWEISTKKWEETEEQNIIFDVPQIAKGNVDLSHKTNKKTPNEHFTKITIHDLHRNVRAARTIGKIKDYLRSMYRNDFKKYGLKIFINGDQLGWNEKTFIDDRLIKNLNGEILKRPFNFYVNDKYVYGWVGVFEKGARRDAGFSVIQSDRVIQGWPESWRPEKIYGPEGGSNDLVNQRLVGEIHLDGFDVSHTKDEILFEEEELEELESKLYDASNDFRNMALQYRKYNADQRAINQDESGAAINELETELHSDEIKDILSLFDEIPSSSLIKESNRVVRERVVETSEPTLRAIIESLEVLIYINDALSPNDPYVIIESTLSKERVIVIVNKVHPHWKQLSNRVALLNFLRHCVYDGVAEWKAYFKTARLDPDTIKLIKDHLLRLPFEIEKHKV